MRHLLLKSLVILTFLGCTSPQSEHILTIFAASSLTDSISEIGESFAILHPDVEITYNFAGSSTLTAQLLQGAPADIFASANVHQMQQILDAGLADASQTFARNQLVWITPLDNPGNIQSLLDLSRPNTKIILAGLGVPIREYADVMLERMANDPAYGSSYQTAILNNVVSEENNVRQVLAKINSRGS